MVSKTWEMMRDFIPPSPEYLPEQYPDLSGKVALITGSNTGIGYEVAKAMLKKNCTVLFLNRNTEKTRKATEIIKAELVKNDPELTRVDLNSRIHIIYVDLSDLTTIKPAVEEIEILVDKIDYSILNAGVLQPQKGSMSIQGYELHIGTNVLGHHLLQKLVHPLIEVAAANPFSTPRVIWITSSAHWSSPPNGGIRFDKLRDASKSDSLENYGQSKVCNMYQAYIYGEKYKDSNIISLGVHPGYLNSEITRTHKNYFSRLCINAAMFHPVYGSYTELFGALYPCLTTEDNGKYIGPWGQFRELRPDIKEGLTNGIAQKLWNWADAQVKEFQ